MENLSLLRIITDGTLYGSILCVVIVLSLWWNPRLWIQDFPKVIREKIAPLNETEKHHRAIFAVILFALALGLPLVLVARVNGDLSFGQTYLYIYGLLMIFNLFDAVILDFVLITVLQPDFLYVSGAEEMPKIMRDPRMHLIPFLKGLIFCAVGAAVLALPAMLL